MKIIEKEKLNILQADDGYLLKSKDDTSETPYYFEKAYIPKSMTLEQAQSQYEEINKDEIIESESEENGIN